MAQDAQTCPEYMKHWLDRWDTGRTGWHNQNFNPSLVAHAEEVIGDRTLLPSMPRVFIPLCGKTRDIFFWLDKGFEVVANEFTAKGFEEFTAENHIQWKSEPSVFASGSIKVHRAVDLPLTWIQGDYFAVTPEIAGGQFNRIYDRASMIAVNPEQRPQYASVLYSLLRPGGKILLVVANYNLDGMQGPPHSIPDDILKGQVFPHTEYPTLQIEKIGSIDSTGTGPFNKPGIKYAYDDTYKITRQQ